MNKSTKKLYATNLAEIIFEVGFIVLVVAIIYFLSKGIGSTDITMELTKQYPIDQANAIKAVADSTTGKINNTIAVTAIFFTVVVAAVSVFQFIKIKDIDRLKEELIKEVEKNNRLISMKISKSSKKLDEVDLMYSEKLKELEDSYIKKTNIIQSMINQLEDKIEKLDIKSIELEIDTNYVQVQELLGRKVIPNFEIIKHYEKIKKLCESNPNIKDNEFLADLYIKYSNFYLFTNGELGQYDYVKGMLEKGINLTENPIMESLAYKVLLKLERNFSRGLNSEIYYLEKIFEENHFDLDNALELAVTLDKRNDEGDLNRCISLIKEIINIHGINAKQNIFSLYNQGSFNNIRNSSQKEEFLKIIDIYNSNNLKSVHKEDI